MGRVGIFFDLGRVRLAGGLGKTSHMHSSFVEAFVEQVFPSSLGLLVHDKASPNTCIRIPFQKPFTFYVCDES